MVSFCDGCGDEIRWAVTPSGAKMPLNLLPSNDGNVLLLTDLTPWPHDGQLSVVLSKKGLSDAREAGARLYLSHHMTCPAAEQFRKARRTRRPSTASSSRTDRLL